ncbi:TRAP transporter substrate-binding protein [Bosea sp. 117]|uniref:TRAP transporter substrate-binding protein n=1 Tax=Bosea sp. 117 TaxID=1125973 RepID=UPI000493E7A5|nr:TRAP transporter substrate-binding protein [Bosea sp. 117]
MPQLTRRAVTFGASAAILAPMVRRANAAVVLRMSSSLTADANSSHYVWFERFQSSLKEVLKDEIVINYFPNNQLGKESDVVQQVRLGAIDMMISGTSIWATITPEIGSLDLGYLFSDNDHVGRALDGAAGAALSGMMDAKASVRVLGYGYSLGARNVYTRHPLAAPSDLHGVKVRVLPVPNFIATLKAMGAVATPIPFGEIYTSLQTGVVDGVEQDAPTVLAGKFYEIAKYCTLTQHIYNPVMPVMNKRSFDRLPEPMKPAFLKAAKEATIYQRAQAATAEVRAFEELKKLGVSISPTDRAYFRAKVEPLWGEFSTQYPAVKPVIDAIRSSAS